MPDPRVLFISVAIDYNSGLTAGVAGVQNQVIPAVLNGIHFLGIQSLNGCSGVGNHPAIHVRELYGIPHLQLGEIPEMGLVIVGGDDQIIGDGGAELAGDLVGRGPAPGGCNPIRT